MKRESGNKMLQLVLYECALLVIILEWFRSTKKGKFFALGISKTYSYFTMIVLFPKKTKNIAILTSTFTDNRHTSMFPKSSLVKKV